MSWNNITPAYLLDGVDEYRTQARKGRYNMNDQSDTQVVPQSIEVDGRQVPVEVKYVDENGKEVAHGDAVKATS